MTTLRLAGALASLLTTAGCGSGNGDGVGGVTASEARALNDAAEMLDSRPRVALDAAPDADNRAAPAPGNGATAPPPAASGQ
ncbi:hypothetical protein [Sphingobium aquiterrae]|uniref:hypothetical protein n=1 Tax=Sphingobium aquiterrae TaxID=2038656 RepID=UPI0030192A08